MPCFALKCTNIEILGSYGRLCRSVGGLVLRISVGLECDGGADGFAVRIQVNGGSDAMRCNAAVQRRSRGCDAVPNATRYEVLQVVSRRWSWWS